MNKTTNHFCVVSFNLQYYIDILKKRQEEKALQAAANSIHLQFEQDLEAFRRRAISWQPLIRARLKKERLLEDEKEKERCDNRVTSHVTVTEKESIP